MRTVEARGLPGSTGAASGDTQGTWQGRDETARNSDGRRSPATKSGRADPGSGVRGGFPGMLVWISARMDSRHSAATVARDHRQEDDWTIIRERQPRLLLPH